MDSKANDEKILLRQIAYLTRLIQQKNAERTTSLSSSSNDKIQARKTSGNNRYKYHVSNIKIPSDTDLIKAKTALSWSASTTLKKDAVDKTYCRTKTHYKNSVSESSSTKLTRGNQLQDARNNAQEMIDLTRNKSKSVNSFSAFTNKKYIHINNEMVKRNSSNGLEQYNTKRSVHVNPKNKKNVYINAAKLLVAKTINKDERTLGPVNINVPLKKQSIYVNPNYSLKQNNEAFVKAPVDVVQSTVYTSISNISDDLPRLEDATKPVVQENKNVLTRIHVNKNFIAKASSSQGDVRNRSTLVGMSFCDSNIKETPAVNIDSLLNDELNKGAHANLCLVGNKTLENVTLRKRKSFVVMQGEVDQDSSVSSLRNVKSSKFSNGRQHVVGEVSPSGSNNSNSKNTIIKSNKMLQSTLKRNNKLLKLVKLNKMELIRKEIEFPLNTLYTKGDSRYSLQKHRVVNKSKKSLSNKFISPTSLDNRIHLSSKPSTTLRRVPGSSVVNSDSIKSALNGNKQVRRPEPMAAMQSCNKPSDLIKLSNTKLIRKRSRSSISIDKTCGQKERNVCVMSGTSPIKRFKSEIAGTDSSMKPFSQNLGERKITVCKGVNRLSNASNSRYKYNSKNTVTSKISQNKLSLVKVNSLIPSPKKLVSPGKIASRTHSNLNLVSSKSRYSVQKQRLSLKRNSQLSCLISLSPTKLIRSKTNKATPVIKTNHKIVRGKHMSRRNSTSATTLKPLAVNKLSSTTRTARSVKTKYKLIMNSNVNCSKMNWSSASAFAGTNHKVYSLKNIVNKKIPDTRRQRLRKRSITIGGIRYRTTGTKLRRTCQDKGKASGVTIFKNKGDSYRVSSGGKSLKRINPISTSVYRHKQISRTGNSRYVFNKAVQRTHLAHYKVTQAKQRSIALLSRKLRKSNEPCLIFHRFGKCSGKERGTCIRLHDKKNVAICKRFLKGVCENSDCLLSHDVGPSKMPTCKHYLAGICVRDNCPYLHVKLNSSAPICIAFLQGFCPNAEKCKKRHIDVCPEFEEKGLCSKGKSCLYPHPKCRKSKQETTNSAQRATSSNDAIQGKNTAKEIRKNDEDEVSKLEIDAVPGRYYDVLERSRAESEESRSKTEIESCNDVNGLNTGWFGQRPKIGLLPAYIPLNFDEQD